MAESLGAVSPLGLGSVGWVQLGSVETKFTRMDLVGLGSNNLARHGYVSVGLLWLSSPGLGSARPGWAGFGRAPLGWDWLGWVRLGLVRHRYDLLSWAPLELTPLGWARLS